MKSIFLTMSALALAGTAAAAQAPGANGFSVRNDSGATLLCMIKANGSASIQNMTIRTGDAWSKSYKQAKDRRIRCEGAYSAWHRISPGAVYSLRRTSSGSIVVARAEQ